MLKPFTPQNWYWLKPDGQSAYQSMSQTIVPITDAAYEAWMAQGGVPTAWPKDETGAQTDAAMQAVLNPYGLKLPGQAVALAPFSFLAFLALFTSAEQAAIVGSADPQVRLFCLMAAGAGGINLADPRTVAGTQMLETDGLIAKGRAAQVLAGQVMTT